MAGGQGEYSQSTSESNTLGLNSKFGSFSVGGGIRIPEYFWPVVVIVVGAVLFMWLKKR